MKLEIPPAVSDEQLWLLARDGDREAFSRIVERYQTLICSIAYSACGALGASEDMAQETFITAWHRLKDLREPQRLRQWLCGIVRNIAANAMRRELRRGGEPESLDAAHLQLCAATDPVADAITREEESLLWRTLAGLPENYREPLVLFYREEQSVAEVARQLDLTEDTVKQRLSRGRSMLREEMTALVESTLTRTRPGPVFTTAVLVALPLVSASTAGAALAGGTIAGTTAGSAGKGVLAKVGASILIGPLIGLACAWLGTKAAASTARSAEERGCILRHTRRRIIPFCFLMSIGLAAVLTQVGRHYTPSAAWLVSGICAWTLILVGGVVAMCHRMDREVERIRVATNTTDQAYAASRPADGKAHLPNFFESRARFLGLPLFAMDWRSSDSSRTSSTACAWLAMGHSAVSPFLAIGGLAVAPIAIGAISVGILSLSLWGIGVGVLATGSLAFGWWAIGFASAAVKCAVGFAAVARDFALGPAASAAHTSSVAKEWIKSHFFADFTSVIIHQLPWWILISVLFALALRIWRKRQSLR